MTKLHRMYLALAGFGATTPAKAMTSVELAKRGGLGDAKMVSTALSQLANNQRGVLGRSLEQVTPGLPKQFRYWVTGSYKGRVGKDDISQLAQASTELVRPKRAYVRRRTTLAETQTRGYIVTIVGPGMRLEREVSNGTLEKVIHTLIEQ